MRLSLRIVRLLRLQRRVHSLLQRIQSPLQILRRVPQQAQITSSVKTFHAGMPYYFVIANIGHVVHEFTILPDKPDGTPLPVASQYENKIIEIEQIAPGTTMTVNLTFSPSIVGRYEIACMMRGHYLAGMRLPIVISR